MSHAVHSLVRKLAATPDPTDAQAVASSHFDRWLRPWPWVRPAAHHQRVQSLCDKVCDAARDEHLGRAAVDGAMRAAAAMKEVPTLRRMGRVGRHFVAQVNGASDGQVARAATEEYLRSKLRIGLMAADEATRLRTILATPRSHMVRHPHAVDRAAEDFLQPRRLRSEGSMRATAYVEGLARSPGSP